ncbi:MAG: DUF1330 domain-containing protein [Cellvibrionaceae bacterium]
MNKSTIIVEGTFQSGYEEFFPEYSKRVRDYLVKHDGEVIRRQGIEKTLYGDSTPDLIMVIDFPSKEIAESIFFKQEYLDIIPLRDKIFKQFKMYLAPYDEI